MLVSLDGKTNEELYESNHFLDTLVEYYNIDAEKLKSKVCLSGRTTMYPHIDLTPPESYPRPDGPIPRTDFLADLATYELPKGRHFHAVIDPHGRTGWRQNTVHSEDFKFYNGDRVVAVLVEDFVTDPYLAHLRETNVIYIFAGKAALDCRLAASKLGKIFNETRVILHGGGTLNGLFLEQGAISDLSLLLVPVVVGNPKAVPLFNVPSNSPTGKVPMTNFTLAESKVLQHGALWLHYSYAPPP